VSKLIQKSQKVFKSLHRYRRVRDCLQSNRREHFLSVCTKENGHSKQRSESCCWLGALILGKSI